MIILGLLVILLLIGLNYQEWWDSQRQDLKPEELIKRFVKSVSIVLPVVIIASVLKGSVVIVPAGHRGVIFDKFQGVRTNALHDGFNFIMPLFQEVILFDIRIRKGEYDATAASKDLQSVHTKVALNFHPESDAVSDLYRNVGSDYAEKIIHPAVQEAVKATTALYTAEELITRREEVKKHIHELLKRQTVPAKIQITETYITDFDFSPEFARAVESKQIAEQQAFKAKRDLDRIKIEADQKIAQARAEAQSLAMQKDAITSNLIELRRIEAQKLAIDKWNGQLPQTMFGGTMPFVDVSRFTQK